MAGTTSGSKSASRIHPDRPASTREGAGEDGSLELGTGLAVGVGESAAGESRAGKSGVELAVGGGEVIRAEFASEGV